MRNETLYKKTCDILFDAYFNDTLEHSQFCACAVGNLIAGNTGEKLVFIREVEIEHIKHKSMRIFSLDTGKETSWQKVFQTRGTVQEFNEKCYEGAAKLEIDITGYTLGELMKIEYAFETCDEGETKEDWIFNGLVSVLEVLKEIHEIKDDDQLERFQKHRNLLMENNMSEG